jgi:hypothetical protein
VAGKWLPSGSDEPVSGGCSLAADAADRGMGTSMALNIRSGKNFAEHSFWTNVQNLR